MPLQFDSIHVLEAKLLITDRLVSDGSSLHMDQSILVLLFRLICISRDDSILTSLNHLVILNILSFVHPNHWEGEPD